MENYAKTLPFDHGYAIDYFVTRKKTLKNVVHDFPPFIVGAWRWDNLLLSKFFKLSHATVIDATYSAVVLHQVTNAVSEHTARRGAKYNEALADKYGQDFWFGSIDFAEVSLNLADDRVTATSPDMWHELLRNAFRSNMLTSKELIKFRHYYDDRVARPKAENVVDKHVELVRQYRADSRSLIE